MVEPSGTIDKYLGSNFYPAGTTDLESLLQDYAGWSLLSGLIVGIILVAVWLSGNYLSKYIKIPSLKIPFAIVWIYGFLVYDIGMCTGEKISFITNAPLAILYAFKIFLFDSDISEIRNVFLNSWVFSFNFALVHFLAAVISTLFVIKHFGFYAMARFRMFMASLRSDTDETFVFWGLNDATFRLIDSIDAHYKELNELDNIKSSDRKKLKYRIIIIRTNTDEEDAPEHKTGFARIFDFLSMSNSQLERLQLLGCYSASSFVNLADINPKYNKDDNSETIPADIIGSVLKMKSLRRLLGERTVKTIHMLFLSDNEDENLHNVELLKNDVTIKQFVEKDRAERRVYFYCHARYNSVHNVIEDQNPSENIRVKVIDSSHISVEILKLNPDLLPVNYVNIENNATVSSPFNALVVGFSEVGRDMVRFLYEYGAFVKHGSDLNNPKRSDFHMEVVDKHMADYAGSFVINSPAIKLDMPFLKEHNHTGDDALISLHQMDCRSVEFYINLEKWIKKLNYIVIATEDDELNMTLAIRIFKTAVRYRKDLKDFCILVRIHKDEDEHYLNIARHYNRLWASNEEGLKLNPNKPIHQNRISNNAIIDQPIHIFGLDVSTYTYDNIIGNTIEKKAREYKDLYEKTVNPDITYVPNAWDCLYQERMQLKDEWCDFYPTYFSMTNLRRMQSQDFANYLHEKTKTVLIENALLKSGLQDFDFRELSRNKDTVEYIWPESRKEKSEINAILKVLAQTEHLRWNASHEILGFVPGENKDETKLIHDCLKEWAQLENDMIKGFDFNVIDLQLGIRINPSDKKD